MTEAAGTELVAADNKPVATGSDLVKKPLNLTPLDKAAIILPAMRPELSSGFL